MAEIVQPNGKVGFGWGHLNLPTPAHITLIVRTITITLSIFTGWMLTNDLIGDKTQEVIGAISSLIVILANALGPLFGVNISPDAQVSAKDVQSMEVK